MTNEELEAIRARVADDVVLPTATTLALIDALKVALAGWAEASSLATDLAGREADLLRWRSEWEAYKASVKAGQESAFTRGADAMREAARLYFVDDSIRCRAAGDPMLELHALRHANAIRHLPTPEDTP